ncbi:MAG TPA: FtsW/RodA/SpoVE family cell cycle protein [Candidatus Saccharimonadales bacterium]
MSEVTLIRREKKGKGGRELLRRHRPDYLLVIFMVVLMMIGLIVLYAIGPALPQSYEVNRQFFFLFVGVAAFLFASRFSIQIMLQLATVLLVVAVVISITMTFLGALPGSPLVLCYNGACRWYDFSLFSFQPAELLKLALLLYLAVFLAARSRAGKLQNIKETLLPVGIIVGLLTFLVIILQKDMGTGIVIIAIALSMLFAAQVKARYLLLSSTAVIGVALLLIITSPHRIARVLTFLNHDAATDAATYHIQQALIAIGSGGFFGQGLAQSVQAFGYLPEAANDSIFAIVAEKFGFIGTIAVLCLFAALLYRIILIFDRSEKLEFRLIIGGITGWVGAHIVVNIGAMLGLIPLTGITLPFLSFGGTSLIFIMLIMGLAFQISRYTVYKRSNQGDADENRRSGRRVWRSRDASLSRYQ